MTSKGQHHAAEEERIRLAHGGGGQLMRDLVRDLFAANFAAQGAQTVLEDAALLSPPTEGQLAFTTDTFVVTPMFFPGGNVGNLAINGTVNDLAMVGATPMALSVALILEEGLLLSDLRQVVSTMARAAKEAGVPIVTGDTKVVARGQGDGIYVNTTGVGLVRPGIQLSASKVSPGDDLVVSGPLGDHGVAVMSCRAGLAFEADLSSDCAALNGLVEAMLQACPEIHAMRDPTRGGLASVLNEFAEDSRVTIELEESALPVRPVVHAACETLGLDPLHVPCEGRLVAAVPHERCDELLAVMRDHPLGEGAQRIGSVVDGQRPQVVMTTSVGGQRLVDLPAGELLPRIC
jgi:hydrogenase expression/formation protein HypE